MITIARPEDNCTRLIQEAIDRAAQGGGGTVRIESGNYVIGTIRLRSHVHLYLEPGARLIGSGNIAKYDQDTWCNRYLNEKLLDRCLIYAQDEEDISLSGYGVIDGNKAAFPNEGDEVRSRPMMIRMVRCKNIHLEGLSLLDAAGWTTAFHLCDTVFAGNLNIKNTPHPHGTADGLDFDGCRNVVVANCHLDTGDDCLCLQNSYRDAVCQNITVTNCVMTGTWAGVRIGLSSVGDIKDVTMSNIVMHDLGCSGLKIQCTEGGTLENMAFSNIVMQNIPRAVFVTLNHYPMTLDAAEDMPHTGKLRAMTFRDISLIHTKCFKRDDSNGANPIQGVVAVGEPGSVIEDLLFDRIVLALAGGGIPHTDPVEEITGLRPEYFVYKKGLPSGAVYFRHTKGCVVKDARISYANEEKRPDIVFEDGEVTVE